MTDEEKIKLEEGTTEDSGQITENIEPSDLKEEKEEKKSFFNRKCKNCEKLELECAEYKSGWQRALADYKNLQNEVEKRRGEWAQMSEIQALEDFLPVYENFKKAFSVVETQHVASPSDSWRKGIEHIMAQFSDVLKAHGLEEIKTVGEELDLKFHEVVGEEESDEPAGTIIKEVETGYVMSGRVVKVAKVIVAK